VLAAYIVSPVRARAHHSAEYVTLAKVLVQAALFVRRILPRDPKVASGWRGRLVWQDGGSVLPVLSR